MTGVETEPVSPSAASPLANLRDLGGLPVAAGTVRAGVLWRADDLSMSPPDEIVALRDRGVRVVLDLRSAAEHDRSPSDHAALGLACHRLSLLEMDADPVTMAATLAGLTTAGDVGRWYATVAEQSAATIVRGLELVGDNRGATLFHCAGGKDRTGIFAAAVLSVLGADHDVIAADYARTDDVVDAVFARLAASAGPDPRGLDAMDLEHPLLRAPADSMRSMLDELDADHGGFAALLREAGVDDGLTESLHERLVEPRPG